MDGQSKTQDNMAAGKVEYMEDDKSRQIQQQQEIIRKLTDDLAQIERKYKLQLDTITKQKDLELQILKDKYEILENQKYLVGVVEETDPNHIQQDIVVPDISDLPSQPICEETATNWTMDPWWHMDLEEKKNSFYYKRHPDPQGKQSASLKESSPHLQHLHPVSSKQPKIENQVVPDLHQST